MAKQSGKLIFLLLTLAITTIAFTACGSGGEPEDRVFDLQVENGSLNLNSDVISVKQGDNVILRVGADERGTFHLHGYDIEKNVGPDGTTEFVFKADATGRFSITFHPGEEVGEHDEEEEEEGEVNLGSFEVRP